jgi:hypothetical protein
MACIGCGHNSDEDAMLTAVGPALADALAEGRLAAQTLEGAWPASLASLPGQLIPGQPMAPRNGALDVTGPRVVVDVARVGPFAEGTSFLPAPLQWPTLLHTESAFSAAGLNRRWTADDGDLISVPVDAPRQAQELLDLVMSATQRPTYNDVEALFARANEIRASVRLYLIRVCGMPESVVDRTWEFQTISYRDLIRYEYDAFVAFGDVDAAASLASRYEFVQAMSATGGFSGVQFSAGIAGPTILAHAGHTAGDSTKGAVIKILGLLGIPAGLLDAVIDTIGPEIWKKILTGKGVGKGIPKSSWAKLLAAIIDAVMSKAFFKLLVEKIGRAGALRLITSLTSKAIPFIGWVILIAQIIYGLGDQWGWW